MNTGPAIVTGALRRRGAAVERAWRPLWKESTVDASEHPLVHELVPTVPQADLRQSDVFIRGMSIGNGQPVVGDMCMGSALHANPRGIIVVNLVISGNNRPKTFTRLRQANLICPGPLEIYPAPYLFLSKLTQEKSGKERSEK